MIPHSRVNVGGHVREMAGGRREFCQPIRAGQRLLGMRRRFDRVNIVMIRTEVIRIPLQNRFEDRNDFFSPFRGFAIRAPQHPWPQIHCALGIKRRGVQIIRITRHDSFPIAFL